MNFAHLKTSDGWFFSITPRFPSADIWLWLGVQRVKLEVSAELRPGWLEVVIRGVALSKASSPQRIHTGSVSHAALGRNWSFNPTWWRVSFRGFSRAAPRFPSNTELKHTHTDTNKHTHTNAKKKSNIFGLKVYAVSLQSLLFRKWSHCCVIFVLLGNLEDLMSYF